MANQLISDTISTTCKFIDTAFEMPVEQEFLLADYDKAIFKIVKTNVEHSITQKYINGSKLVLEGYLKINIYYQPPEGENLTLVSKKLPFQKQFDLSQAPQGPYFIQVDGQLQYINTRAINPTRIDARGIYRMFVRGYTVCPKPVGTAVNTTFACYDSREINNFCLCGRGAKQFSVEDEIDLPPQLEKVLTADARCTNMTLTAYKDKVNLKGEISAEVVYTMPDSRTVQHTVKTFVFNQIAEIAGTGENCLPYGEFTAVNVAITQNPDTHKINCIVTCCVDIKVFRKESVIALTDAFSKKYRYSKETRKIVCDDNIRTADKIFTVDIADEIGQGYTPVCAFAAAECPALHDEEGETVLKTKITVSAIMRSSENELECFVKSRDVNLNIGEDIKAENEYIVSCVPMSVSVSVESQTLNARITAAVQGFVINHMQVQTLYSFEENTEEDCAPAPDALVLYYGKKGEKIFDIAMKYKTDTQLIRMENSLEEATTLAEDRMLLIPAYNM